jgi:hypothetical protein
VRRSLKGVLYCITKRLRLLTIARCPIKMDVYGCCIQNGHVYRSIYLLSPRRRARSGHSELVYFTDCAYDFQYHCVHEQEYEARITVLNGNGSLCKIMV